MFGGAFLPQRPELINREGDSAGVSQHGLGRATESRSPRQVGVWASHFMRVLPFLCVSVCVRPLPRLERTCGEWIDFLIVTPASTARGDAPRCRIRPAALGELFFRHASAPQESHEAVIALMASGLLVDAIRLRALPGQILPDRPRPRPRRRILDRDDVVDHVLVDTGPPFDEAQVLARPLPIRFRTEVGHFDDERIAFPVCAGITRPLADVPGKVWPIAHGNDALPSLALTRI